MKRHQFNNVSIGWLLDEVHDKAEFNPELRHQNITYPIPPDLGEAQGNMILTRDGFSLYLASHKYAKNIEQRFLKLGEINVEFEEDSLYIEMHSGTVMHQDQYPKKDFRINPGEAAFYHTKSIQFVPLHDTYKSFKTVALSISISKFKEMFDEENVENLLGAIGILKAPSIEVSSILPSFRKILEDAFTTRLTGKMQEVQIQSRVLEFLCEIIQYYTTPIKTHAPSGNKLLLVRQLHDELVNLQGRLPRLSELSKQTGIRQGELNKAFEEEYGLPIHRFVQHQRLIEAHEIIQTTNIPLKQLSDRLGYSHVNHFNSAFSKYFGYPPGVLRKKRNVILGGINAHIDR